MSPGLRARKHARTKQAIYDAAMRLFAERGYDDTTVDAIAEAAEVSRATFFNYFGTKDGVLHHYSNLLAEHLIQGLQADLEPDTPLNRMQDFLLRWVRHVSAHRDEARQVYLHAMNDPRTLLDQTPARRRLFTRFAELVTQAQERQEIRADLPAHHLAGLVLSLYQSVVISHLFTEEPLAPLVDSAWAFVLRGMRL